MRRLLLFAFTLALVNSVTAQMKLTGKVASAVDQSRLPGVNVVIKGTSQGTITDIEGQFSIDVPQGATLLFSFIGYNSQEFNYPGPIAYYEKAVSASGSEAIDNSEATRLAQAVNPSEIEISAQISAKYKLR